MQQSSQAHENRKDKQAVIFGAACRVIREKGYHQARITDIAQEAGISYGLVYHYFKSKADLFDAILEEWWTGLFAMMDEWDRTTPGIEEKLGAIVRYFLDEYERRPDLVHIFITEISRSSANLTPTRVKWIKLFMDRIESSFADAQREKIVRSDIKPRYLTHIFLGAIESFISAMVLENQPLRGRSQKQRISGGLLEVFFNGARPTGH
ncbi:MAG: TetR/AcrR family transcriptional regulator [Desulfomonilaceae bacterium]|nr:TetR/AcrR family transcriptional regulator [Desulfomonilaceae bacterium]